MIVHAYNPGFGMASSPVAALCRTGNLPQDATRGVDADWASVTFASIAQLGAIAAVQLCGKTAGNEQHTTRPRQNVMSYMQRADYFSTLGIDVPEGFKRHDTSTRLLPVSKIPIDELEAEPNRIAGQLKTLILSHLKLSESVSDNMDLALGEIIDNVVQHSGASAPGVACAQYYPSDAFIEVCVADCGVGIPASMAENPDYVGLSDADLLAMAFEQKTGQWYGRSHTGTNKVSGGMGLSFASHLVRAIGGHIWAISHSTAAHLSRAGTEELEGLFYPGTLIVMRVPETLDEVSEIEMTGEGSDNPSLWNDVDGRHSGDSGALW